MFDLAKFLFPYADITLYLTTLLLGDLEFWLLLAMFPEFISIWFLFGRDERGLIRVWTGAWRLTEV